MAAVKLRAVPKSAPSGKKISIWDFWKGATSARTDVDEAIDVLVRHGADRAQLRRLVPAKRAAGKPGRPRKWSQHDYEVLLAMYEDGKALLQSQRKRVTDDGALLAIIEPRCKQQGIGQREIKSMASALAKRLSDGRKTIRK